MFVTVIAIFELLVFMGVAMAAEEAKDPKRSIPIAYVTGILPLLVLAIGVMTFAGASGDWTKLANINDPLPQAMKSIVGENSGWTHMLVWLELSAGRWDGFNRERIDVLLATYGKSAPGYDAAKPPYVVFDWDNTSIFLDVEEAVLVYQLQNLVFGATPEQLDRAIRKDVPLAAFGKDYNNAAGAPVNVDAVATDIVASYTWLYRNYAGLKGDKPLDEVKRSPHYQAFITKMRYLYEAIGDTFDHAVSYPWVTYHFTGMTEAQGAGKTLK